MPVTEKEYRLNHNSNPAADKTFTKHSPKRNFP